MADDPARRDGARIKDVLRADDYITREYAVSPEKMRQLVCGIFQIATGRANAAFTQELSAGIGLGLDRRRHYSGDGSGPSSAD